MALAGLRRVRPASLYGITVITINVPMSGSPISIPRHKEPLACPQCGTAWRLNRGLCVSCLLSRGLDAEMHDRTDT